MAREMGRGEVIAGSIKERRRTKKKKRAEA
jgi:hypothetical protein